MSEAGHAPVIKQHKIPYHHKHRIQQPLQCVNAAVEPSLLPQELLDQLLIHSIKTIVEEQAYAQKINEPWIDSVALEALRAATDEFIFKLCQQVTQSMQISRRIAPIAPDFDWAFRALSVPVPSDQLKPYKHQSPPQFRSLPTPPPEDDDEFHIVTGLPEHVLGSELSRQQDLNRFSFNVKSLPPVPSAHTYRDTAVLPRREKDAKKIRELATEEGKLGEQALRKLAGAMRLDGAMSNEPEMKYVKDRRPRRLKKSPIETEEAMFEHVMREMLDVAPKDFEMGPVVSSEKQFRMPDEGSVKRRKLNTAPPTKGGGGGGDAPRSYNLAPPPLPKPRPSVDDSDITFDL